MADNKISSSKKEIYTKLLDIAEKYIPDKNTDFLKTGFFGYMMESMAMMMRDSTFHKSMIYNESFLNKAVIPETVYNWAKTFNVEVQKAIPKYSDAEFIIPINVIDTFITQISKADRTRYSLSDNITNGLILDKNDRVLAGDYYFSLEHSILITKTNNGYFAKYLFKDKYTSTNFQGNVSSTLMCINDGNNLRITARLYQYNQTVVKKQVVTSSFLNKVQTFEFEDQFCGANLFYEENSVLKEIPLQYSDLTSYNTKAAYYNLVDANLFELSFKEGFIPSGNSKLILYLYTTKGASGPSRFTGDALMLISKNELRSLPLVINFPDPIIGGKDAPSISEIKETIINEISTRKTITTKSDLDNYFNILTALIENINDGKVKFIKKRDDIIKRIYNAYLLLRDNVDDSSTNQSPRAGVLSSCVPTNTMDVTIPNLSNNDLIYPKFTETGDFIFDSRTQKNGYYISPFYISITRDPLDFVMYIYNLTNDECSLSYQLEDNTNGMIGNEFYIIPTSVSLYRGFSGVNGLMAEDHYTITLNTKTNFQMSGDSPKTFSSGYLNVKTTSSSNIPISVSNISAISTETSEENVYNTTLSFNIYVADQEFNTSNYSTINIISGLSTAVFKESEKLYFDFSNVSLDNVLMTNVKFMSDSNLTFFQQLDDIMESSLILNRETTADGNIKETVVGLKEVPLIHSSFFDSSISANESRREQFIKQLFTYIKVLKENLNKLETSTFFNLKFYNTYGLSNMYYTDTTNLKLELEIVMEKESLTNENLKAEIRSFIRKIIDKMNETTNSISISTLISTLTNTNTYGNYIKHIKFIGLNNTFNQYIAPRTDVDERDYPPEWLNLEASSISGNKPTIIFTADDE